MSRYGIVVEECRYGKGAWSECDPKTNMRSRSLTLKKGNQTTCESTKTIQKKCKKGAGFVVFKVNKQTQRNDRMLHSFLDRIFFASGDLEGLILDKAMLEVHIYTSKTIQETHEMECDTIKKKCCRTVLPSFHYNSMQYAILVAQSCDVCCIPTTKRVDEKFHFNSLCQNIDIN
ncbi:hypothetical protein HHI36_019779 [Cryptolaemus montrouzieri]|uniref:Pleiotrophin/Midkine C-terminal domain-containing protein n=1 Tax=Cryptolaemus montrouzieri TaxID=559131 RepID=A0ABD2N9V5_9CUCU